jgi:hypothetical protein
VVTIPSTSFLWAAQHPGFGGLHGLLIPRHHNFEEGLVNSAVSEIFYALSALSTSSSSIPPSVLHAPVLSSAALPSPSSLGSLLRPFLPFLRHPQASPPPLIDSLEHYSWPSSLQLTSACAMMNMICTVSNYFSTPSPPSTPSRRGIWTVCDDHRRDDRRSRAAHCGLPIDGG